MRDRSITILFSAVLALLLTFSGCTTHPAVESTAPETFPDESLTLVVTQDTIEQLEAYPHLKTADLTGSTCYEAMAAYAAAHPEVDVIYTVPLGSKTVSSKTDALTLTGDSVSCDALLENLQYLPHLAQLHLEDTGLTRQQIADLEDAFPQISLSYTVSLLDELIPRDTAQLDLSAMTSTDMEAVISRLELLPLVTEASLPDTLTMTEVKTLMDAHPQITFLYTFDLFGKTVSTTDQQVEFVNVSIGNKGEAQIRQALDILPFCTYFKLDSCGISNEIMASIRDDYPDAHVVWRVWFDKFNCLTDETTIRATSRLNDENSGNLKYCTEVMYMDIGHNPKLSDISFCAYMPKLQILILSESILRDLSPLANCQELEFLELCYCYKVKDLSSLSGLKNLKYLNISFTGVTDLSPLERLPLERFVCRLNSVPADQQAAFLEKHPEDVCLSVFTGKQPFGYGWRYIDNGSTFNDYYANMRIIFRYDDKSYWGNGADR